MMKCFQWQRTSPWGLQSKHSAVPRFPVPEEALPGPVSGQRVATRFISVGGLNKTDTQRKEGAGLGSWGQE